MRNLLDSNCRVCGVTESMYRIENMDVACQSVSCLFIGQLFYCVLSLLFQRCCLWYFVCFLIFFKVLSWIPVFCNNTNPNPALAVLHYGTLAFVRARGRDCCCFCSVPTPMNHSLFCMLTNIKSLFSIGCCNMQNKIKLLPL